MYLNLNYLLEMMESNEDLSIKPTKHQQLLIQLKLQVILTSTSIVSPLKNTSG